MVRAQPVACPRFGTLERISEVAAADREFVSLFRATAELRSSDPAFDSYVHFNISGVERGRRLVGQLRSDVTIAGSRALHIGAGSGGISIALAEAGATVTAIEADELRYRWAQTRIRGHGHQINLIHGDPERLRCADRSFDLVVLDDAIEHVDEPGSVLAEIGRVLAPGGVAYIGAPNRASVLQLLRDPHYRMLGVVLMPRRLATFYVERIRRHPRAYWVNKVPTRRWIARHAAAAGMRVQLLPFEGADKLRRPDQIADKYWHVRALLKAANRARIVPLLERVAHAQSPYLRFLAVKAPETSPSPTRIGVELDSAKNAGHLALQILRG